MEVQFHVVNSAGDVINTLDTIDEAHEVLKDSPASWGVQYSPGAIAEFAALNDLDLSDAVHERYAADHQKAHDEQEEALEMAMLHGQDG